MNWIVAKKIISENIVKLEIKAYEIAIARKPGHHVIIKIDGDGEPFPMVISRVDAEKGTITLYVHKIGVIHQKLASLVVGDELFEVSGPYGYSVPIKKVESVGINGIYRVSVCGGSKYICVDGIDFNAFYPDFDTMIARMESRLSKESVGNQNYSLHQLV